jgi:Na+:H+ antiporter
MLEDNYELLSNFNAVSGEKVLAAQELSTLNKLSKNEIITPKLYIMLLNELNKED